jgi:hypothetical protein
MTNWIQVPGYGYRVQKGDKIRIETMVYNPTCRGPCCPEKLLPRLDRCEVLR